jgi:transcription initiation factor TFIIIB Brf1 subunit/transcription initiation factor TFIIB
LSCPHCGAQIIFDGELQAYVCPRCGVVVEDRPLVGGDDLSPSHRVGSYIARAVAVSNRLGRKHLDIYTLEKYGRNCGKARAENVKSLARLLISICRSLNLDWSVCVDAERILLESVGKVQKLSYLKSRRLVAEALLKVAWSRGVPLNVQKVEELLGAKLFNVTESIDREAKARYYAAQMSAAFAKVAEAVLKVSPNLGDAQELIKLAREALERVLSGSYKYRALAAFYYASRALGVKLNMSAVCREVGLLSENCTYNARALALKYLFKP